MCLLNRKYPLGTSCVLPGTYCYKFAYNNVFFPVNLPIDLLVIMLISVAADRACHGAARPLEQISLLRHRSSECGLLPGAGEGLHHLLMRPVIGVTRHRVPIRPSPFERFDDSCSLWPRHPRQRARPI